MKIKAVIFDMDGVLVDSELFYHKRILSFFKKETINVPEERLLLLIGANSAINVWPQIFDCIKLPYSQDELFSRFHIECENDMLDYSTVLDSGAKQLLIDLKEKGYKVALASSTKLLSIQRMIEQCNLNGLFHLVTSGEMFKESKPHPEIYLHTAECLHLLPQECLVIEDSLYGIESGKRAGMWVAAKKHEKFQIDQSKADYIINELSSITGLLSDIQ